MVQAKKAGTLAGDSFYPFLEQNQVRLTSNKYK